MGELCFEAYTLSTLSGDSYVIHTNVGSGPSRLKFKLAVATDCTLPPMLSPMWLPSGSQASFHTSNSTDSPTPEPLYPKPPLK